LNYDGIVNSMDASLLKGSLNTRRRKNRGKSTYLYFDADTNKNIDGNGDTD
jgi:hypothetical protein